MECQPSGIGLVRVEKVKLREGRSPAVSGVERPLQVEKLPADGKRLDTSLSLEAVVPGKFTGGKGHREIILAGMGQEMF